jgi:hypothetical protein
MKKGTTSASTLTGAQRLRRTLNLEQVRSSHFELILTKRRTMLAAGIVVKTRIKKLVVLVGQKKAIAIAVRNVSGRRRWSKLSEWLNPQRLA